MLIDTFSSFDKVGSKGRYIFREKNVETAAQVTMPRIVAFWAWENAPYGDRGGDGGERSEFEATPSSIEDALLSLAMFPVYWCSSVSSAVPASFELFPKKQPLLGDTDIIMTAMIPALFALMWSKSCNFLFRPRGGRYSGSEFHSPAVSGFRARPIV